MKLKHTASLSLLSLVFLTATVCHAGKSAQSVQQGINETTSMISNIINSINESANAVTRTIESVGSIPTTGKKKKSATTSKKDTGGTPGQIQSKCYTFNPDALGISEFKGGWAVVDTTNPNRAIVFAKNEKRADVELAQQAIQQLRINEVCYSDRLVYYLASGNAPEGAVQGEKGCMQFNPQSLVVEQRPITAKNNPGEVVGSVWLVVDPSKDDGTNDPKKRRAVFSGGDSETAAYSAAGVIRNFQYTNRCWAGFNYMRK